MRLGPIQITRAQQQQAPRATAPTAVERWERVVWPERGLHRDLENARKLSLIYACMEERANSIAAVVPQIWQGETEVESGDLYRLLREPDERQDWIDWWRTFWAYHDAAGNVYVHRRRMASGAVAYYELLRPDLVRVVGAHGITTGYRFYPEGFASGGLVGASSGARSGIALPLDDVAHFRSKDLLNDYYGLGPVGIVMREAGVDLDATTFSAEWVLNKGKSPGGYLSTDELLDSEETVERVKRRWWESLSPKKAGDIAVLEKGLKYDTASPMDSPEMPHLRQLTESRICGAFGIDGRLVGANYAVQASSGTADFSVARRVAWEDTLVPFYKRVAAFWTRVLQDDFGDGVRFALDFSDVPALRESADSLSDRVVTHWEAGLITRDTALARLGYPPDPNGRGNEYIDGDGSGDAGDMGASFLPPAAN